MRPIRRLLPLVFGPIALAACAVPPPAGPSVMALPGEGKTFEAFQQDDMICRNYAFQMSGGQQAANAGTDRAVGSAVVGTALGAAAGAALGSLSGQMGAGAAIGGATGLLVGSAAGAGNAQAAQGWPSRAITIIGGFPNGAGTDLYALGRREQQATT